MGKLSGSKITESSLKSRAPYPLRAEAVREIPSTRSMQGIIAGSELEEPCAKTRGRLQELQGVLAAQQGNRTSVLKQQGTLPTTWLSLAVVSSTGPPERNGVLLPSWLGPCEALSREPRWIMLMLYPDNTIHPHPELDPPSYPFCLFSPLSPISHSPRFNHSTWPSNLPALELVRGPFQSQAAIFPRELGDLPVLQAIHVRPQTSLPSEKGVPRAHWIVGNILTKEQAGPRSDV